MTPLGAVIRGIIAGVVGTAAFDMEWFRRARKDGLEQSFSEWEFSSGIERWEDAPAPAHVGKRLYEGMLQRELKPENAAMTNNIVHWGYGVGWGAAYGVLAGSTKKRSVLLGVPLGLAAFRSGYAALAPMGLYRPMKEYDRETLTKDATAHLVFGLATAAAFRLISGRRKG